MSSICLVTACSGGPGGDDADDPGEVHTVTLSTNPSTQSAPVFLGLEEGIFEDHGIDLEIVPQTDVAAIISGVASGQYDFGFATVVHIITANSNDIPIRAVATVEGQQKTEEDPDEGNSMVAGPDSGIESPADLEDSTMAVVGLSSLNSLAAFELAERAGVDPESIELVQLPFGQMPAALAAGDVDAAVVQAPFISEAMEDGSTIIAKPNVEVFPDMAVGVYTSSQQFIDSDEEVVQAFNEAIVESQQYASDNVEDAQATLVEHLEITEEAAAESMWNTDSNPHVNAEGFETAQRLMIEHDDQTEELDVDELIWSGSLE